MFPLRLLFVLIFMGFPGFSHGIKDCLAQRRRRVNQPQCPVALVPTRILQHDKAYPQFSSPNTWSNDQEDDVCAVVTTALFTEYPVYDAVLMYTGMCMPQDIEAAGWTPHDVMDLIPTKLNLVGLSLYGRDLMLVLQEAFDTAIVDGKSSAYPKAAGIRYDMIPNNDGRVIVQNAEIMTHSCAWEVVDPSRLYHVLTTDFLARGTHYGYHRLAASKQTFHEIGTSVQTAVWFHAESTCQLQAFNSLPYPIPLARPVDLNDEDKDSCRDPKMTLKRPFLSLNATGAQSV